MRTYYSFFYSVYSSILQNTASDKAFLKANLFFLLAFISFFCAHPSIAAPIDLTQPINLTSTAPASPQTISPTNPIPPQNSNDSTLHFAPILPQDVALTDPTAKSTDAAAMPADAPDTSSVTLTPSLSSPSSTSPAPMDVVKAPIVEQSKVHITQDENVTVESTGLADAQALLGLSAESWHTTPRAHIHQLLAALPIQYQSPILHKLAHDFLSASLRVPSSDNPSAEDNLLLLRAEKLAQMGHSKEAYALLNNQRSLHAKDLYLKLHFEQEILRKHVKPACEMASAQLNKNPDTYWEKAIILCQILEEKNDAATLSLSVLGESHAKGEQDFITMAQSILAQEPALSPAKLTTPDMLTLILLNQSPTGIKEDIIKNLPSSIKHQLILNLNPLKVEPNVQLHLLEEAVEYYRLPGKTLGEHYIYFGDGNTKLMKEWEKQDPTSFIEKDEAAARAHLFIQAFAASEPKRKSDYLSALLQNARKFHRLKAVSQALKEHLEKIKPDAVTAHIAQEIIPALIFSGHLESTCQWQSYVAKANPQRHFTTIPLLILACPTMESSAQDQLLSQWYGDLTQSFSHSLNETHLYAESIFAILEVMGKEIPFKLWQQVGTRPPYQTMRLSLARKALIHDALSKQRIAEALAQVLINFGNNSDLWSLDNLLYLLRKLQSLQQTEAATLLATEMIEALPLPKK